MEEEILKEMPAVRLHFLHIRPGQEKYVELLKPLMMIETHMTFEERIRLFEVAMSQPKGFVGCEIGSFLGASTSFLAAAAREREGHVHAVDTWHNDAMPDQTPRDTWQAFLANTDAYRPWITPHRGVSLDVKGEIPPLDFLFIDGDHSYEGVLGDLKAFVPKLKPGGTLVLHDYDYESVKTALTDYLRDRPIQDLGCTHSLKVVVPQ
jgi:predicted O-methyltransferase YrrM